MLKRIPLAPFALAMFPILAMLASNAKEVSYSVAFRPLVVSLVVALLLLVLIRLILKRWDKAALVTAFILILFYSYGQVYSLLEQNPIAGVSLGRHRYLIILYAGLLILGLWVLIFKLKNNSQALLIANVISLTVLAMPLVQLFIFSFQSSRQQQNAVRAAVQLDKPLEPNLQPLPDVYYIVLDSHTRNDALIEDYSIDNSPYLNQLREMGFYVADCSRSNYDYTQASMVAALNMDYLTGLGAYLKELNSNDIWILLKQSRVRQLLENAGYKTVAFDTGYEWSRLEDADIYMSLGSESYSLQKVNPFEAMLIKSSALLILTDSQNQLLRSQFKDINFPYSFHVNSQNFILEQLPQISKDPDPTFTFVHLLIPHVPFVFNPDGSIVSDPLFYNGKLAWPGDDEHRIRGYANQIEYIDRKMVEIVKTILAQSQTPPIIVIHGDHGLRDANRYEILNAYFLPGNGDTGLYPNITPVNSFRVIFNKFFGTDYPLLPDLSYNPSGELVPETSPVCLP
jgi:Sulfatase